MRSELNKVFQVQARPITVDVWSKAWIVFARSNDGIVGLNPTQAIYFCVRVYFVFVLSCV
jgi:hypothetical protein